MNREHGKRNATLKDIAIATGYSINTVSRALRDKDDIAPATRERIKEAARNMGHINNMLASSLRLGYTNTIAVILGDVSNPHFAIMMKEIEECAREQGYASFLINTDEDEELELKAIEAALNKSVDGIIICSTQKSDRNLAYLQQTGTPFVLIGRHFEHVKTDAVVCNDELGGYQATRFLLEQGHRHIVMLHGPRYISSASERLNGYLRALQEWNIPVDERLVFEVPVKADGCHRALDLLFQQKLDFSAIFAFSDVLAWDIWAYLIEHDKQVPQDFSLIGFDHIQSRLSIPFRLNSISSYKSRMSTTAVDLLVDKMQNPNDAQSPRKVVIDTKLVYGNTVINKVIR